MMPVTVFTKGYVYKASYELQMNDNFEQTNDATPNVLLELFNIIPKSSCETFWPIPIIDWVSCVRASKRFE